MAIDERSRHELFLKLEQFIGPGEATTLMELLPPVGWADVATKADLDHLGTQIDSRFESMEHKLVGMFHAELNSQTKVMFFSLSSLIITLAALAFTSAQLL